MPTPYTLGHSPDPDDAFMFYALAEGKVDTRGHAFQHILQDIQTLNERATRGELHISAISIHAYAHVLDKYALLPCGASMGDGYGPMLIATTRAGLPEGASNVDDAAIRAWLKGKRIAVPGKMTSAYLALGLYLSGGGGKDAARPDCGCEDCDCESAGKETAREQKNDVRASDACESKACACENAEPAQPARRWDAEPAQGGDYEIIVVPFDEIFQHLRDGKSDVGLIIHEGQLTYARDGFLLVRDFGAWWKAGTGLPLPLGGNVIRKDIPPALRKELSDILEASVRYGLAHRAAGVAHAMPLARDMDTELADRFIGMYVNDYTLDYGESGRRAIALFLRRAAEAGLIPAPVELEFVG